MKAAPIAGLLAAVGLLAFAVASYSDSAIGSEPAGHEQTRLASPRRFTTSTGIHKIKHVVIITQENRSFAPISAPALVPYLLSKEKASWRYYIFNGTEPACESDATLSCAGLGGGEQRQAIDCLPGQRQSTR